MLLKYAERVHGARLSALERRGYRGNTVSSSVRNSVGERQIGEREREAEEERSGSRSRVKDRGRIERRREKMGETGSGRPWLDILPAHL